MRKIIAMRSIPGGGKSFQAAKLANELGSTYSVGRCSADYYFDRLGRFDASKLPEAHGECFSDAVYCVQKGIEVVIIDNTNLQTWEISPYAALANAFGYDFEIMQVSCDPKVAFARQTHGVPEKAHAAMVESFRNVKLLPWWKVTTVSGE